MSLKARVLLGFAALLAIGVALVADTFRRELRPRYLEAAEDSLNDTAHTLASLVEAESNGTTPNVALLGRVLENAKHRRFEARIFGVTKTAVGVDAYVTDAKGIVLFDSRRPANVGRDYSRWNDVYLTLRGRYGARASRLDPADPATSVMHVAAPIMNDGRVIGVLTVAKANDTISPFLDAVRSRLFVWALYAVGAFGLLSVALSSWITLPLTRLTEHVRRLRSDAVAPVPELTVPELRELGREFDSLWEELRGRRYVERYVQALTHEIKGPLTSIRGAAELLDEQMPEGERKRFEHNILRESRRIEGVVERMLELSALENRPSLRDVETVAVESLLGEVMDALAPTLEARRLTVRRDVGEGLTVRGERFLLHHMLANLIDNAARFSPDGGELTVSAERASDEVRIAVADRGPGVPEFALERVFERFYSLPDPRTGAKSFGLGLSFVREAATLHRGRVALTNRPGGGAVATLLFPA